MTSARDRRLLYASAFVRAMATSTAGVTVGAFLGTLGAGGATLGTVVSAGLAGAALAAVLATCFADRVGRRRFLVVTSLFGAAGTIAFALASSPLVLAVAAFVGMVNGMGKDRGAALILEQAVLPSMATPAERTAIIARYTMMLDLGHALGALAAGAPAWLASTTSLTGAAPHRATLLACAACGLVAVALYRGLGETLELGAAPRPTLSPRSQAALKLDSMWPIRSRRYPYHSTD